MPGDSESGTVHSYLSNFLSGLDVTNVYSHVFTCTCQQNSIMRETDGSDWPFQPWECLDAGQLIGIPNTDKSISWSSGEVSATPAKFYADAVARMSLKQHIHSFLYLILVHIKISTWSTCWTSSSGQVRISIHPWPFVRKKRSLLWFQLISFTSNLNCFSALTLYVL